MKKLFLVCLMAFAGVAFCSAGPAAKGVSTVVFATDIQCESCEMKVMNNVPVLGKGVKDVTVDMETKELTVVFDASKNDVKHLVKQLGSLKVKATPVRIDGKTVTCGNAEQCASEKKCEAATCTDAKCCGKESCTGAKCCEKEKCAAKK